MIILGNLEIDVLINKFEIISKSIFFSTKSFIFFNIYQCEKQIIPASSMTFVLYIHKSFTTVLTKNNI